MIKRKTLRQANAEREYAGRPPEARAYPGAARQEAPRPRGDLARLGARPWPDRSRPAGAVAVLDKLPEPALRALDEPTGAMTTRLRDVSVPSYYPYYQEP